MSNNTEFDGGSVAKMFDKTKEKVREKSEIKLKKLLVNKSWH